ncbi:ATP-binding protein [Lysinibacillus sphaericus]
MQDSIVANLLLNFFFILSGLLIIAIYYDVKKKVPSRVFVIFISTMTILLCMMFGAKLGSGIYIDLKRIPFFLASLYFGPLVSFILMAVIIFFRLILIGDEFILLVALNYFSAFLILAKLSKSFYRANRTLKLIYSAFLCLLMTGYNILMGAVYGVEKTFYEHICIIFIPLAATIISILIAEMLRKVMRARKLFIQQEKLKAVGQLAATISHEVSNPLTSSKGFLQLMRNEQDQNSQQRFLDLSLEGIDQASHVIEEYLTFANTTPDKIEHIKVKELISGLVHLMKPIASNNGVSIKYKLLPNIYIEGQTRKLKQCMMNIMKNSIESMPSGGVLHIEMTQPDNLVISFSDTGSGMTAEQVHRFGEPFYTTKDEGTGLGIMAASIIVNSMKGNIQVKSEVNRGTTVYLEFTEVTVKGENKGIQL